MKILWGQGASGSNPVKVQIFFRPYFKKIDMAYNRSCHILHPFTYLESSTLQTASNLVKKPARD
jgi:hypothetical protein